MKYLGLIVSVVLSAVAAQSCTDHFVIDNTDNYQIAKTCSEIGGKLEVSSDAPDIVQLSVTFINGALIVKAPKVKKLKLHTLQNVMSELIIEDSPLLEQIYLPKLETINGPFRLRNLPALKSFDSPKLLSVNGPVDITGLNNTSTENPLRQLRYIQGSLTLSQIQAIKKLSFAHLFHIGGSINIINSNTTQITFPKLHTLCDSLTIKQTPFLETLDLKFTKSYLMDFKIDSKSITKINLGGLVPTTNSIITVDDSVGDILSTLKNKAEYSCKDHKFTSPTDKIPVSNLPGKTTKPKLPEPTQLNPYDTPDPNNSITLTHQALFSMMVLLYHIFY